MNPKSEKIKYPSPLVIEMIRYTGLLSSKILWRMEHHGTENIPQNSARGLLLVSNHQTYFDPFWLCLPIRRKFRFMAWDEAFNWFAVGRCIRYLGAFPVSLAKRGVKKAMIEALRSLRDGAMLIIFPEGSRGFADGRLLPFKSGAVRIAMEAKVPILPVTIRGGNKVWAQDLKFPHLHKVEIFYHPIFEIPELPADQDEQQFAAAITERLKTIIESKLLIDEQ
jgi:1-acyl-sn-glycerol-3-phosphate acyltransferase